MIVATAGHVDHGKTRLVQALTGVDTDILAEEKRRGLTIDIGFAYLPLAEPPTNALAKSASIGFIDVPGHERFIKNALCGLTAADFVLLVVAADDGIMPQTREHLSIIDLLGIRNGAVVISKIDRVPAERVAAVQRELETLRTHTLLESWPTFALSAATSEGVDVLRAQLQTRSRARDESQVQIDAVDDSESETRFRMPIDRAFEIKGAGLVVTGTVTDGRVRPDDFVTIAGSDLRLRVRTLRVHDDVSSCGRRGQRCALNLAGNGLRKEQIRRGCWVTSPGVVTPIRRFDAEIRVVNDNPRPLQHWTPVHLHLAAAESTARVAVLAGGEIAPGQQGLVQLVSDQALGAAYGDRLIIRDQSARRTLGGGRVLDIFPPIRGRAHARRLSWLQQMAQDDPVTTLQGLLDTSSSGVDLEQFAANRNLDRLVQEQTLPTDMVLLNLEGRRLGFSPAMVDAHCNTVLQGLEHCHRNYPDESGFSRARLGAQLQPGFPARLLPGFINRLQRQGQVKIDSAGIALCSRQQSLNPVDSTHWKLVEAALTENGLRPITPGELAQATQLSSSQLKPLIERLGRAGWIVRLSPDLLVLPAVLGELQKLVGDLERNASDGVFSVAEFRDASGIGRNRSIDILECFDARGITLRSGSGRRLLPASGGVFARLKPGVS
jgi:selenocysteine-specific elongation factor